MSEEELPSIKRVRLADEPNLKTSKRPRPERNMGSPTPKKTRGVDIVQLDGPCGRKTASPNGVATPIPNSETTTSARVVAEQNGGGRSASGSIRLRWTLQRKRVLLSTASKSSPNRRGFGGRLHERWMAECPELPTTQSALLQAFRKINQKVALPSANITMSPNRIRHPRSYLDTPPRGGGSSEQRPLDASSGGRTRAVNGPVRRVLSWDKVVGMAPDDTEEMSEEALELRPLIESMWRDMLR